MLSLSQVTAFLGVVETGTFQGAASRLGLAPATISQNVRSLEDSLGVTMIIRSRVRCEPTAHGRAFLRQAKALVRLAERAEKSVRDRPVLIGASGNVGVYLLQPYVRRFISEGPDAKTIDLTIATNPQIADSLQSGEIDLAVMEWWDNRPGFVAHPWRKENMVVIVSPDHDWAKRTSVTKDELLGTPMIGGEPGTGTATLLRQVFGTPASDIRVSYTMGSTEGVKAAVKAGLGISLVMESAVRSELSSGSLKALQISEVKIEREIVVVIPDDTPPTAPSAHFMSILQSTAA